MAQVRIPKPFKALTDKVGDGTTLVRDLMGAEAAGVLWKDDKGTVLMDYMDDVPDDDPVYDEAVLVAAVDATGEMKFKKKPPKDFVIRHNFAGQDVKPENEGKPFLAERPEPEPLPDPVPEEPPKDKPPKDKEPK